MVWKESRKYYDEHAKHDEASSKASETNGKKPSFTGKSAQDLVVAELTGDKKVVNITFADAVVDPDDVETLQDMTVQALNDALGQIDEATKKSMGAFAGKLPF